MSRKSSLLTLQKFLQLNLFSRIKDEETKFLMMMKNKEISSKNQIITMSPH